MTIFRKDEYRGFSVVCLNCGHKGELIEMSGCVMSGSAIIKCDNCGQRVDRGGVYDEGIKENETY